MKYERVYCLGKMKHFYKRLFAGQLGHATGEGDTEGLGGAKWVPATAYNAEKRLSLRLLEFDLWGKKLLRNLLEKYSDSECTIAL